MTLIDPERTVSGEEILRETPEEIEQRWYAICLRVLPDRMFFTDCSTHRMNRYVPGTSVLLPPIEGLAVSVEWPIDEPSTDNMSKHTWPLPGHVTARFWDWVGQSLKEKAR